MSGVPYLGCKLSLVSKSENRYEGILYTVDTKESTVALAKVQCFGTERRPTERPVAPRDEIYEYIIFRAGDIKDLHVCEPPKPQPVTTSGLPNDPAILQHSAPQATCGVQYGQSIGQVCGMPLAYPSVPQSLFSSHSSGSRSGPSLLTQKKAHTSDAGVQVPPNLSTIEEEGSQKSSIEDSNQGLRDNQSRPVTPSQRGGSSNRRFQRGRGGRRGRGRGRGGAKTVLKFDREYDFELANTEFLELETKLAKNETKDDSGTETLTGGDTDDSSSYDKQKSFFDNISCEASLVAKGIARFDWRTERKLNVETFGVTYNNWMRRRRGRGRFRRGGIRGRGALASNRTGTDTPKAVTFGDQLVTEVEIERPETPAAEISKAEDIPTIELVVPKEEWVESETATKEDWK